MSIIVGSARIDERGKISGGKVGDQTGKEVSTEAFYMHSQGWYILRPKDANVADAIAKAMKDACSNSNIGYDQKNRNGVVTNVKKYGTIDKIATKTEADCSSLVRACIWQATGKDVGDFYTGNEASVLENSGLFLPRKIARSSNDVYDGDVLVTKTKGHTVVVVSGRSRVVKPKPTVSSKTNTSTSGGNYMFKVPDLVKGDKGEAVKLLQRLLVGHGYSVGEAGVDGDFGPATKEAVKKFQEAKKINIKYPGTVGPKTWKVLIGI